MQLGSFLQTLFFLPRHNPKGEFLTNLDVFFDFLPFDLFFDFLPFKHLPVVLLLRCPTAQDFLHLLVDLFLTYPILQDFLVLNVGPGSLDLTKDVDLGGLDGVGLIKDVDLGGLDSVGLGILGDFDLTKDVGLDGVDLEGSIGIIGDLHVGHVSLSPFIHLSIQLL